MRVEFHSDVADPVGFACRLLRKAYRSGARVVVMAPAAVLARVDQALWVNDPIDFIPHARWSGMAAAAMARTPIWLTTGTTDPPPGCSIALNVGLDEDEAFGRFERVIEIVSTDAEDVAAARRRWRRHRERGIEVEHHAHGAGA